jgi:hypothetical protein
MRHRIVERAFSKGEIVLTKATVRVANRLGISQKVLALVIGVSESSVSRMRNGAFILEEGNGKAFELATLLLQLYDALDSMMLGDERAERAWLTNHNLGLRGRPIELIQQVHGLVEVVSYLVARRST